MMLSEVPKERGMIRRGPHISVNFNLAAKVEIVDCLRGLLLMNISLR